MTNLLFVGGGKMGLSHLAIANSLSNTSVQCMVEKSVLLRQFYKRMGFETSPSLERYLHRNPPPDGAVISVPTQLHFPIAKTCIEHRIACFIEKPLTTAYSDSLVLRNLAFENGVPAMVGYVNRFNRSFQTCREIVRGGHLGLVQEYENSMLGAVATTAQSASGSWRFDRRQGGGCLYDYGPHAIDLGQFMFGRYESVMQSEMRTKFSANADDQVEATIKHGSGLIGKIFLDWSRSDIRNATNKITIKFRDATVTCQKEMVLVNSNIDVPALSIRRGENRMLSSDSSSNVPYYLRGEEFSRQLESFVQVSAASRNSSFRGQRIAATLEEGAEVDRIISEVSDKAGWST